VQPEFDFSRVEDDGGAVEDQVRVVPHSVLDQIINTLTLDGLDRGQTVHVDRAGKAGSWKGGGCDE
jgi:hypothetical protein